MSEKLDKLRADLARARERRIQLNNRIELLERRIAEAEKVEVAEMVRVANLTPEQLAALLQQNSHTTPMVMEKQNATMAVNRGDRWKIIFSLRFSRSTRDRPIAAARKPFRVCRTVSQKGNTR